MQNAEEYINAAFLIEGTLRRLECYYLLPWTCPRIAIG